MLDSRKKSLAAIFWISFILLFTEVALIRWISAEIRIFSYFHNLVLLFCFLGMGLGCAFWKNRIYPLISIIGVTVWAAWIRFSPTLGPISLNKITDGLSTIMKDLMWYPTEQGYPLFSITSGIFLMVIAMSLLVVVFIPLGQTLGKYLQEHLHPIEAYSVNLVGSLFGCIAFYWISLLSAPPLVWLLISQLSLIIFIYRKRWQTVVAIIVIVTNFFLLWPEKGTFWSPYQKITIGPAVVNVNGQTIPFGYQLDVNSVGYMLMSNYTPEFQQKHPELFPKNELPYDHYNIAYRFCAEPGDVLIVGSGAGNDIAGALRNGARSITAVEIDPKIIEAGLAYHPEKPYQNKKVTIVNDDARSFFKRTKRKFDLIVFGLLDAHTLSSSYSNVRLDNYVYTIDSFREARNLLKPNGTCVLLFEVYDDFIGHRLFNNLKKAFQQQPIGFIVRSGFRGWGGVGFICGNMDLIQDKIKDNPVLRKIIAVHDQKLSKWANRKTEGTTDDWPYLFLRTRSIPKINITVYIILLILLFITLRYTVMKAGFNIHFFLLGAAFMLLEVQNISKLILLFGATWTVNSFCISGIFIMALIANNLVSKGLIGNIKIWYALLFISIFAILLTQLSSFNLLPYYLKLLLSIILLTIPFLFAGVIFAHSFEKSENRAIAMSSNLFGAMIGGMLECISYLSGIKMLLIFVAIIYALAFLTTKRKFLAFKN